MSLVAIVAAGALFSPQEVSLDNGLGVLRTCEDENLALLCLGYIKGVTDGTSSYALAFGLERAYCAPPNITMGDMRDVIVEDLRERRDYWSFVGTAAVIRVLRDNFPCPTSDASPTAPDQ